MRARRHVRHVQLCLFCGVSGDVDLCPRDADGDTANDGVCGYAEAYPADTENDADGDGICGGGDCATAVVSYPYDRMIMPITTPCAATRIPRSSRTCCWRASRRGSCSISSTFGLPGTVGGESHLKSTSQHRWRVRRPRLVHRENDADGDRLATTPSATTTTTTVRDHVRCASTLTTTTPRRRIQ